MLNLLKKLLPEKYKREIKEKLGVPTLHWSLANLKKNNFNPSTVIDAGAYEGNWTLDLLEVYPSAKVLMVEAQQKKEVVLKKIIANNKNLDYAISLLSSEVGIEKIFEENETASQVITNGNPNVAGYSISTQTLDELLLQKNFPYPDLIKLDVQGHELEVLRGAENSLAHAEVCLLELSLMELGGNTPLLLEMLTYMNTKDFQPYDISQFMRRPFDKALIQIDMFFVKKNSPLVTNTRWA